MRFFFLGGSSNSRQEPVTVSPVHAHYVKNDVIVVARLRLTL